MARNHPIPFPSDQEFKEKWLTRWTDDLGDLKKVEELCNQFEKNENRFTSTLEKKASLLSLIQFIDLTTLAGDDTKKRVSDLTDKAIDPLKNKSYPTHCAAVCVYPARVPDVVEQLASKNFSKKIAVAAVAGGFPSGQYRLESRLLEVQLAVADGATEIDIVINRAAALEDNWSLVHQEITMMRLACKNAHLKTILATGELGDLKRIYIASMVAMMAGSDFIKTSTGKESINATLPVTYVMCQAIKHFYQITGIKVGFKPAGGIRTPQEAMGYKLILETVLETDAWTTPELFRIGASTLLDNIVKEFNELKDP